MTQTTAAPYMHPPPAPLRAGRGAQGFAWDGPLGLCDLPHATALSRQALAMGTPQALCVVCVCVCVCVCVFCVLLCVCASLDIHLRCLHVKLLWEPHKYLLARARALSLSAYLYSSDTVGRVNAEGTTPCIAI